MRSYNVVVFLYQLSSLLLISILTCYYRVFIFYKHFTVNYRGNNHLSGNNRGNKPVSVDDLRHILYYIIYTVLKFYIRIVEIPLYGILYIYRALYIIAFQSYRGIAYRGIAVYYRK